MHKRLFYFDYSSKQSSPVSRFMASSEVIPFDIFLAELGVPHVFPVQRRGFQQFWWQQCVLSPVFNQPVRRNSSVGLHKRMACRTVTQVSIISVHSSLCCSDKPVFVIVLTHISIIVFHHPSLYGKKNGKSEDHRHHFYYFNQTFQDTLEHFDRKKPRISNSIFRKH